MAEKEAVLTLGEAAEFLGVNDSTASNVLAYMEALGVV
jgi:Mn-dependent DtxR family transcriptional regulator